MKIAIMGCGAMGSVYAGLLASAGNEVVAIDAAPSTPVDLVVIATKAAAAREAAREARSMLGAHTMVLTIQNGLGSADEVAEEIGSERLLVGIAAAFGASLRAPGHVRHEGMSAIRLGAYAGADTGLAQQAAEG